MSSKFLKSKLLTFALAAAMLFGVIGFAGAGVANAEAEPSADLHFWNVTENADTPMVDKLVSLSGADANKTQSYSVVNGEVEQTSIDSRKGVKLVSKNSGENAVGSEFRFAGVQNGTFEVDFRIISEHTAIGSFGATVNDLPFDDTSAALNKYTDVVKVTFIFTDSVTGSTIYLSLLSGGRYGIAGVKAYVKTDAMTKYRSRRYNADNGSVMGIAAEGVTNDNEYYPADLVQTSFCNAYGVWNESGNNTQYSSKIGFDPETMQLYGYCRKQWNGNELVKRVILDLDDAADMAGWEKEFTEENAGLFKDDYTVSFRIDRMTGNDEKVEYNGEEISYDRYATMMLYEVNGEPATAASIQDTPPTITLEKISKAEFMEEIVLPVPKVIRYGEELSFADGGAISVTDPNSEKVTVEDGKFTPEKIGNYTVTYSWKKGNSAAADTVMVIEVKDTVKPTITLKADVVNDFEWSADLKVNATADDVTAEDASGVEVTVVAYNMKNEKVQLPLTNIGMYKVIYTAKDGAGNTTELMRLVKITDSTPPVISGTDGFKETAKAGDTITLPTVTATDNTGEEITVTLIVTFNGETVSLGNEFVAEKGEYVFTWRAVDASNNVEEVTKTLTVKKSGCSGSVTETGVALTGAALLFAAAMLVLKRKKSS